MNILVCDDDREIARALEVYLGNEGYQVFQAHDGLQALQVLEEHPVHLILMDVMMPRMDGIQATIHIRQERNIPIIMLSAKSEDYDKINGLNVGADDYITKPFHPMELIARVKSCLRRYTSLGSMPPRQNVYRTGGLELDDERKQVTVDGSEVAMTRTEYGILRLLMASPGRVFSMEEIYEAVWEEPAVNPQNTVAVHIRRIREKIEINPRQPRYLTVVWGVGYRIEKR